MTALTKYDVAFIGIRLLAIYLALEVIGSLPSLISIFSTLSLQSETGIPFSVKFVTVILPLMYLVFPILLWLLSNKIAQAMTSSMQTPAVADDSNNLQAIMLTSIGVFILMTSIPVFVSLIAEYVRSSMQVKLNSFDMTGVRGPDMIDFILPVTKIILSLLLIFSARNLSRLFKKLRYT